jgi:hypothetical protein
VRIVAADGHHARFDRLASRATPVTKRMTVEDRARLGKSRLQRRMAKRPEFDVTARLRWPGYPSLKAAASNPWRRPATGNGNADDRSLAFASRPPESY